MTRLETVNESFPDRLGFRLWPTDKIESCAPTFSAAIGNSVYGRQRYCIQVIMPKTGISPKSTPQQQANEREDSTAQVERQCPPPPGMGKLVDKTA